MASVLLAGGTSRDNLGTRTQKGGNCGNALCSAPEVNPLPPSFGATRPRGAEKKSGRRVGESWFLWDHEESKVRAVGK